MDRRMDEARQEAALRAVALAAQSTRVAQVAA
jgi:hypothetical protein